MTTYRPSSPFNVAAFLMVPTTTNVKGVIKKTFVKSANPFFCSFRTFGGTEKTVNDVIVVEDTATVETWYNPCITSDCNIEVSGKQYEILGTPENIQMRNQFMLFKVRAIKGGA